MSGRYVASVQSANLCSSCVFILFVFYVLRHDERDVFFTRFTLGNVVVHFNGC